jgi:hypothetical protein
MNNAKLGVLACGVIGLVGCFLPLASGVPVAFWDMHSSDMAQTLLVMIGYALPLVMGLLSLKGAMRRSAAIASIAGFAFVIFKFRGGFLDLITHGGIGARLMGIGALAGVVFALLCVAKPAQKQ